MRTRTQLEKPLIARMQQDIARGSYFAKEKNPRQRSVLSHVPQMPFCSAVVCPSSWLQWTRPRLEDKKGKKKSCYDPDKYTSQELALSSVGSTRLLRLLWLGLSDDAVTIDISQLAVFISSYAFYYDIALSKEELLATMLKACKYGQEFFTFADAIFACPAVYFEAPTDSTIDTCFDFLSKCCTPLTWSHIGQFVRRLSTPLFSDETFEMIKRYAGIQEESVVVSKVAFRSFILRLCAKPSLEELEANFPSFSCDFSDRKPQPGTLSLLTFCQLMKRYGLDEFIR